MAGAKPTMVFALDGITFAVYGDNYEMHATDPDGRDDWMRLENMHYTSNPITGADVVRYAQAYLYNPTFRESVVMTWPEVV